MMMMINSQTASDSYVNSGITVKYLPQRVAKKYISSDTSDQTILGNKLLDVKARSEKLFTISVCKSVCKQQGPPTIKRWMG